jgi:hypothetical protein
MSHNSGTAVYCTVRRVALTPADIAGAGKDDPARPEPANPTGTMIGYSRLPISGQNLNLRSGALTDVGCIRVLASKLPCKTAVPELTVPGLPPRRRHPGRGGALVPCRGSRDHARVGKYPHRSGQRGMTAQPAHPGRTPDHPRGAVPQAALIPLATSRYSSDAELRRAFARR